LVFVLYGGGDTLSNAAHCGSYNERCKCSDPQANRLQLRHGKMCPNHSDLSVNGVEIVENKETVYHNETESESWGEIKRVEIDEELGWGGGLRRRVSKKMIRAIKIENVGGNR